LYSKYPTKRAPEGSGDFKVGGHCEIRTGTVKYAEYLVLLAREKGMLHGIIERLTEIGRCHGMEKNVDRH
jgi:hypothetical protein